MLAAWDWGLGIGGWRYIVRDPGESVSRIACAWPPIPSPQSRAVSTACVAALLRPFSGRHLLGADDLVGAVQHGLGSGERAQPFEDFRVVLERQAVGIFFAEGRNIELFAEAIVNPGLVVIELGGGEDHAAFQSEGAEVRQRRIVRRPF